MPVLGVRRADGTAGALKLATAPGFGQQCRALVAAQGRGYARVPRARSRALRDPHRARPLAKAVPRSQERVATLVRLLLRAWEVPIAVAAAPAAAEDKPSVVGDLIDAESPREDRHGRVLDHAAELLRDLGPDRAAEHVLAHGDPHAENALARGDAYAFVDPDGLRAEPAYDVGVALRDEAPGSSNSTGERVPPRGGAWLATAAHLVD